MITFYNTYEIFIVYGLAAILFGATFIINEMRLLNIVIRKITCILLPIVSIVSFIHLLKGVSEHDTLAELTVILWLLIGYGFSVGGGGALVLLFFFWLIDYKEHDGAIC